MIIKILFNKKLLKLFIVLFFSGFFITQPLLATKQKDTVEQQESREQLERYFTETADTEIISAYKRKGKTKVMELLHHGANINAIGGLGLTPLMWAAIENHQELAEILLDNKAIIDLVGTHEGFEGYTALTYAAEICAPGVVQTLVERKASIDHKSKTGATPLMYAAEEGCYEAAKILMDNGASVHSQTDEEDKKF